MLASAVRLIAPVAAVALVVVAPASAHGSGIGFTFLPKKVVQGDSARVAVSVRPTGSRCTLSVRYQGGAVQGGLPAAVASGGHATWTWKVPADVQAGPAAATVRCTRGGSTSRPLMIVGRLVEPKIDVVKQGFSTRPNLGAGTRLSYGIILHNESPKDATGISVQVNFVMADNHLLGTDVQRIDGIGGNGDYALGRQVSFPGLAPIVRLEVVVQVDAYSDPSLHNPTLANMHMLPQIFDPAYLGSIEGEVQNVDPTLTLSSANLSAVVFDSAGNIIGGGSGFVFEALPPGARSFVQLNSGFDTIPIDQAASEMVSVTSSWKRPGS